MNRITYQNADGSWGISGINIKDVPNMLYGAMCKLRDYENSGLEPEEVMNLREIYTPDKNPTVGQYMGKCKCSSLIYDNDKYCSQCGVKLNWSKSDE